MMNHLQPTSLLAMACCLLAPAVPVGSAAVAAEPAAVGAITSLTDPMTRQVVQRRDNNIGLVLFVGTYEGNVDGFQASSTLQPEMPGTPLGWTFLIDVTMLEGHFFGILRQPAGGFYNMQIRPVFQGQPGTAVSVSTVGVGEVFITAGQSNTTNWGTPTGFLPSPLVSCFIDGPWSGVDPTYPGASWRYGADPQPAFDHSAGGSVWPTMATNLAQALNVPIGIYAAGMGGSGISNWMPGAILVPAGPNNPPILLFDRVTHAIEYFSSRGGVRAVLWDQGETDYYAGTSEMIYGSSLKYIIDQSRAITGVPVKWMVATASTPLTDNMDERLQIESAQASVIDYILTFPGPNTDSIGLSYRINDTLNQPVHFDALGLVLLGGYWGIFVANVPGFLNVGHLP